MRYFLVILVTLVATSSFSQTPYGNCDQPARYYQERYEASGQIKDMVCMQKAMERDLNDPSRYSCPSSTQYYQTQYEQHGRSSDLVCMQKALEKELQ